MIQTITDIASKGRIARLSAKADKVYSSDDGTKFVIVHTDGKSELRIANGARSVELTDKVADWVAFFSPVFFVNDGSRHSELRQRAA
jgi:hypothetical protein